jgi:hypothetical protein
MTEMNWELYQVWYRLDSYSGWELFANGGCSLSLAQAIATSLPSAKVLRVGTMPEDDELDTGTGAII